MDTLHLRFNMKLGTILIGNEYILIYLDDKNRISYLFYFLSCRLFVLVLLVNLVPRARFSVEKALVTRLVVSVNSNAKRYCCSYSSYHLKFGVS